MHVFFTVTPLVIVCTTFYVESKGSEDSDVDHEDVESVDYTNASLYTTSEMRDRVLAEWKGKTEEIQGYFDQLPSEEFKENSEDLKFKYYYERKGVKGLSTNQVFNITPHLYNEPTGPMYTIEVNDSYVPKYRITTSEEERMEKYGTFNSESDSSEVSSEDSSEEVKKKKKKKKKESSESGGEKPKKKKEKKTRPSNMDPKEKRKKKKPKTAKDEKRKDLMKKTLNGEKNVKKIETGNHLKYTNRENVLRNKLQGNGNQKDGKFDKTINFLGRKNREQIKQNGLHPKSSNQNNEMKTKKRKVDHKLIDNNEIEKKLENLERQRKRSRQSINGNPSRPYL